VSDVLLLSTYELGHVPLGLALPAAFLAREGVAVRAMDLAVEELDEDAVRRARVVALSVPMHTALRGALRVLRRVRALAPEAVVAFYGLYAPLHRELLLAEGARIVLGGEHEEELVRAVKAALAGTLAEPVAPGPVLARLRFPRADRTGLPALERYAKLLVGAEERVAGYTEASRGCLHHCRHCPIPAAYGGRFFVVPVETVLEDVAAQVEAGARHVTFGDPDFLNGPGHARAVVRGMRERFPTVTFDVTAKVEHLLGHEDLLPELAAAGCAFVVTALESLSDVVLERLAKGHTRADALELLDVMDAAHLPLRPSLLPFTPWSTLDDYAELLEVIDERDLAGHVDPVQLSIRLLLPPGSLVLAHEAGAPWLGALDPPTLTVSWRHPDPRMDALHAAVERICRHAAHSGQEPADTLALIAEATAEARDEPPHPRSASARTGRDVPRLSEPWFC
jgi:radical SAM superfamily enzyme YgiQ (UPF0313 family)